MHRTILRKTESKTIKPLLNHRTFTNLTHDCKTMQSKSPSRHPRNLRKLIGRPSDALLNSDRESVSISIQNLTSARVFLSRQETKKRRLPRTIGSDHRDERRTLNLKRDVRKYRKRTSSTFGISMSHMIYGQKSHLDKILK